MQTDLERAAESIRVYWVAMVSRFTRCTRGENTTLHQALHVSLAFIDVSRCLSEEYIKLQEGCALKGWPR